MNQRQKNLEYFKLHRDWLFRLGVVLALELLWMVFIFSRNANFKDITCLISMFISSLWIDREMPKFFREEEVAYRCFPVSEAVILATWQWKSLAVGEFIPLLVLIAGALDGSLNRAYAFGVGIIAIVIWFTVELSCAFYFYQEEPDAAEAPKLSRILPSMVWIFLTFFWLFGHNAILGGPASPGLIVLAIFLIGLGICLHIYNLRRI